MTTNDESRDNAPSTSEKESVGKLLEVGKLLRAVGKYQIPTYQRPYKWTEKNVRQLIRDIANAKRNQYDEYRLGNIIVHREKDSDKYDIVDGQQRFVTLLLIAMQLQSSGLDKDRLNTFQLPNHVTSKKNIHQNCKAIKELHHVLDNQFSKFLLDKCTFIQIELADLSEAFQFFDSQNTRGKALEPHDLLKAFHLREMKDASAAEKKRVIETWEAVETAELSALFAFYLYGIRRWAHGDSTQAGFSKDHIDEFKGVTADALRTYPCSRTMYIVDRYVHDYNTSLHRDVHTEMQYPFQIDQPIINGARFFEMIAHYVSLFRQLRDTHNLQDEVEHYKKLLNKVEIGEEDDTLSEKQETSIIEKWKLNGTALRVMHTLATYPGRWRTGDMRARLLFDCCVAYYIDKFGLENISQVITIAFNWAYYLRLEKSRLHHRAMDVHAFGLFKDMREMRNPRLFLEKEPTTYNKDQRHVSGIDRVKELFDEILIGGGNTQ